MLFACTILCNFDLVPAYNEKQKGGGTMDFENELMTLIGQCENREEAILTAMEVIHAELERLLSEPESLASDHPGVTETSE